jgi:hypothetical protein
MSLVLIVSVLGVGMLFAPLGTSAQTSPRAKILSIEGETTTYHVEDKTGKLIEVEVPSGSTADVLTKPPSSTNPSSQVGQAQRKVSASVVAVDTQSNKVKVVTQAGQTIHLEMATQDLQIGDQLTLVVP